jgi:hypothetical protein
MDDLVKKWKLQGHVYLWRYKGTARNYPGWHLTADAPGCASLLELLDAMGTSHFASETRVPLSVPTDRQVGVPNAPLEHVAAKSLELYHSPTKVAPRHWQLTEDADRVRLELGRELVTELRRGIADVVRRAGDYCIGAEGQELWFWWS